MIIRIRKRYIAALTAAALAALSMVCAAGKPQKQYVSMPAIMYHQITLDNSQAGRFVVTAAQFEEDMDHIRKSGYNAVSVKQLEDYAVKGSALPDKPILVTVDDGYESFYVYAFPVIKKLGINCLLSVIGTYSDLYSSNGDQSPKYAHCTWEQIGEMKNSGLVDIGNHTWSLHSLKGRTGCRQNKGESDEEYIKMLSDDVTALQERLKQTCGFSPTVFTYPYGKHCKTARDTVDRLGFPITLGVEEKVNRLAEKDPGCLKMIKRFNRDGDLSTDEFFRKIEG